MKPLRISFDFDCTATAIRFSIAAFLMPVFTSGHKQKDFGLLYPAFSQVVRTGYVDYRSG